MTEDQQWNEINYPSFFGAIGQKITAAKAAMEAIPADVANSGWLETNVNGVTVLWREEGADCYIKVGQRANQEPFYELKVPTEWLAA